MNRTQLQAAGRRLFGANWKSPLSRAIGYSYRHLLKILSDERPIDVTIELALIGIEAQRAGFVPSWGQVKAEPPEQVSRPRIRKKRQRVAEQVRS